MLASLAIRDVVLIEQSVIDFTDATGGTIGLCVLTGETGAGKSILLDSLGLALGARADVALIRTGAEQAVVTAMFEPPLDHPARQLLIEAGLSLGTDEPILVRRLLRLDGKSKAFVNDQAVSVALLRTLGESLVEIHGQSDDRGLLNPRGHRDLLDLFAGNATGVVQTAQAYQAWRGALAAQALQQEMAQKAALDRDWLVHAVAELQRLSPQPGEEAALSQQRSERMKGQRLAGDLEGALTPLAGSDGAAAQLRQAARRLDRLAGDDARIGEIVAALDRAVLETDEALDGLQRLGDQLAFDPDQLDALEARLFEVRALARKHRVEPDALGDYALALAERLEALEAQESRAAAAQRDVSATRAAFMAAAEQLSDQRREAAGRLDGAVAAELAPLKLEAVKFRTRIVRTEEEAWSAGGLDHVMFEVATNPGAPFGPLAKIASGGEMSRIILALKVALAAQGVAGTLIFDEIDRGVGGAVAGAIGGRLARLGKSAQVLVVTHSPQVASAGNRQWRIEKNTVDGVTRTSVTRLSEAARREEIARMLSGDAITEAARTQAETLLAGVA